MLIVTGGAGFIGSNIVRGLNGRGIDDVVVVDDLTDGHKYANLVGLRFREYLDKDEFAHRLRNGRLTKPTAIFHQGACTDTTEWNGRLMMDVNYRFSVDVLEYCLANGVPMIYASSAAVYGASQRFVENDPNCEKPLNVYGFSKLVFDQHVRRYLSAAKSQIVGLRYFNAYGPGESHKGRMASVIFHFDRQLRDSGEVCLFERSHGYEAGEQRRDFIYVDDIVAVNLWFLERPRLCGIFNLGTGSSATFNAVARAVIDWHGHGSIRYIPFPEGLEASYQSYTEADIGSLRQAGFDGPFVGISDGVRSYLDAVGARE